MTKKQYKRIQYIFLLNIFTIGVILGSFYFEISNSDIKFNENLNLTPKSSEFDDSNTIIVSYFENNIDDTHEHSSSSSDINFTSSSIEGDYSLIIDQQSDYARWYDLSNYNQGTWECMVIPGKNTGDDSVHLKLISVSASGGWPVGSIYYYQGQICGRHNTGSNWVDPITYTLELIEDQLYHFAYSFGPLGTFLYVDGLLVNSSEDTRPLSSSANYYGIGAITTQGTPVSFNGTYDMFRFSDIQRTSFPEAQNILSNRPEPPILNHVDTPDYDGKIILTWQQIVGISYYKVYRYTSQITKINNSITFIGKTELNRICDFVSTNQTYYYVVTAINMYGGSNISNNAIVVIEIPPYIPLTPILYQINSPDDDGTFTINWSPVENVEKYFLFRDTSFINTIEGLEPIFNGLNLNYTETNLPEGTYYYCVIAINGSNWSEISNIDRVIVKKLPDFSSNNIKGYSNEIFLLSFGLISIILVRMNKIKLRNCKGME